LGTRKELQADELKNKYSTANKDGYKFVYSTPFLPVFNAGLVVIP
jgi:hypothetical protein